MPKKLRYCSFCGKSAAEVFYLVEGPDAKICDECVILSGDVIQNARARVACGEPKQQQNILRLDDLRPQRG